MAQQHGLGRGLSSLIPQKSDAQSKTSPQQKGSIKDECVQSRSIERSSSQKKNTSQSEKQNVSEGKSVGGQNSTTNSGSLEVDIDLITKNSQQPRTNFDEQKLEELAASIKEHGVIQPLIVIKKGAQFELIAGERRLQASKRAGLSVVPVTVRPEDIDEQKKLELALIENIQRHDLDVIEEARGYNKLAEEFELSQEEIAVKTGKSRSAVANRMRLLKLPIDVQRALSNGEITEGHAKAILALSNPEKQRALFQLIVAQHLTVRQAEDKTKSVSVRPHERASKDPKTKVLEEQLTENLGTKVNVLHKGDGGNITINYYTADELERLTERLLGEDK